MASSELWIREFNEASKLAEDIDSMTSASSLLPPSGPVTTRHLSATRRKVTILKTKLETLQSYLSSLPNKNSISKKEMKRRQEMLVKLNTRVTQMAETLNMNSLANRDSLLGPDKRSNDIISRTADLDNHGIVSLQRKIIEEQDENLDKLEDTVISTKHIALAVNEELDLHTKLLDDLDNDVDTTNSRLQLLQRKLAFLNKKTKGGCSYLCLMVVFIVILIVVIFLLAKYL